MAFLNPLNHYFTPKLTVLHSDALKQISFSTYDSEFSSMVRRFSSYSEKDIQNLGNDRLIHLVNGGMEALNEPLVVNAFQILYDDVAPIRLGGNVLFKLIDDAIKNAKTTTSQNLIEHRRISRESDLLEAVSGKDEISASCRRACTLENIPLKSPQARKYREKYLGMVRKFRHWGETNSKFQKLLNDLDSNSINLKRIQDSSYKRIEMILAGCISGAKNPGVVKALGILYEDYSILRAAGDFIFGLVEKELKKSSVV